MTKKIVKIECPYCKREISDAEPLSIRGVANVEGTATLRGFHDNGVAWEAHDSWDEEFRCPHCGKYFTPDFVALRELWHEVGVIE